MSEFGFGRGHGTVEESMYKRIDEIAKKYGAGFTNPRLPEGQQYWFFAPNRGEPHDSRLADTVLSESRSRGAR